MKVRFLQTRTVQAVDGETYQQGQVYDLPEASARRWIERNAAAAVAEGEPAPASAAASSVLDKVVGALSRRKKGPQA